MPITHNVLAGAGDEVDRTAYPSATHTPTAGRLVLAACIGIGTSIGTCTVSGNSLTWAEARAPVLVGTSRRLYVFRSMGLAPTNGATTFTWTTTLSACQWSIVEFIDVDTSGADGAGAVGITNTNSGTNVTTLSVSVTPFASLNNASYGAFHANNATAGTDYLPGTGFTQLHEIDPPGATATHLITVWRNDNDTTIDYTGGLATDDPLGIGLEIKASGLSRRRVNLQAVKRAAYW